METKNPYRKRSASPSPCCRSGKCQDCLENDRWDRVFQQNSADPHYYNRRQVLWPVTPLASSCSISYRAVSESAVSEA
jgi:hypothetical protein